MKRCEFLQDIDFCVYVLTKKIFEEKAILLRNDREKEPITNVSKDNRHQIPKCTSHLENRKRDVKSEVVKHFVPLLFLRQHLMQLYG